MSNSTGARYEREYATLRGGSKISRLGYEGPDVLMSDPLGVTGLRVAEVKYRRRLPLWLEEWHEEIDRKGADYLVYRRARGPWMALLPESRLEVLDC